MSCGMGMIKYLLFIFNFIFALFGLAILVIGVIVHLKLSNVAGQFAENVVFPSITLITVGSIIFVIAFFGCWGAIRENHCMTVTFASLLLTILIIQVAVAIFAFIVLKNGNFESADFRTEYTKLFDGYWANEENAATVDTIQLSMQCCGIDGQQDYRPHTGFNGTIPGSCCGQVRDQYCQKSSEIYNEGCVKKIKEFLVYAGSVMGGVALGIAGIELCGIIFALCLANSIKNSERRGYRV